MNTLWKQAPMMADTGGDPMPPPPDIPFDVTLLGLASVRGLGRIGLRTLVDAFEGHLSHAWQCTEEEIQHVLVRARTPRSEAIAREIVLRSAELQSIGYQEADDLRRRHITTLSPHELPTTWRSMKDHPRWLFVEGDPKVLKQRPCVAVVGTREAAPEGRRATSKVVEVLAAYQVTLVSGLAEGIDEEAHKASLRLGMLNVAFLGHGVNLVFPNRTAYLRKLITAQGGAVATEYLPNEKYQRSFFVERNRLQAGLADIVIPVEAKSKSGTAHTVRYAREFDKRVVGIQWRGANGLLEDLAKAGDTIVDIWEPAGRRSLDAMIRNLVERAGHDAFPLQLATRKLLKELDGRAYRRRDVDRLIEILRDIPNDAE